MSTGRTDRIELAADFGAAAAFAAASSYALVLLAEAPGVAAAAGILAFWAAFGGLRSVRPHEPDYSLADFTVAPVEIDDLHELVLTDADRLPAQDELVLTDADRFLAEDELMLEDVLREPMKNSRVVRLFDPSAMPTPGQLHARINRHLAGSGAPTAPPDASQALHQALADLRRSLR